MKSNSKKLAYLLVGVTSILTSFAIYKSLEGIGTAIWSTGIPSAIALYANKQFQDRKWGEINKDNKNGNS